MEHTGVVEAGNGHAVSGVILGCNIVRVIHNRSTVGLDDIYGPKSSIWACFPKVENSLFLSTINPRDLR